jgi:hypothetical protein
VRLCRLVARIVLLYRHEDVCGIRMWDRVFKLALCLPARRYARFRGKGTPPSNEGSAPDLSLCCAQHCCSSFLLDRKCYVSSQPHSLTFVLLEARRVENGWGVVRGPAKSPSLLHAYTPRSAPCSHAEVSFASPWLSGGYRSATAVRAWPPCARHCPPVQQLLPLLPRRHTTPILFTTPAFIFAHSLCSVSSHLSLRREEQLYRTARQRASSRQRLQCSSQPARQGFVGSPT